MSSLTLAVEPVAGKPVKLDAVAAASTELARKAAEQTAGDFGVGEALAVIATDEREVTHLFSCPHPAYRDWQWAVTVVRASRARVATVNEVELLPASDAHLAQGWVPWADRIGPRDLAPGMLLPTPDNDPRLEPGYTGGEEAADLDPAELAMTRVVVTELALGRERVLTREGRERAADRWINSDSGPQASIARQAPAHCSSCGYFVPLQGGLGTHFGACTNEFSPADARVVSLDHGCGGHSDVAAEERGIELDEPVHDTLNTDSVIFD